jgi:hypothetical protein
MRKYLLFIILIFVAWTANSQVPQFGDQQDLCVFKTKDIDEASGLVASRKYPGILWTHNDSNSEPIVYAINTRGNIVAEIDLGSVKMRDWEDIAIAPAGKSGEYDLYIGEIGDNDAEYSEIKIFQFREPILKDIDGYEEVKIADEGISTITFEYPDGARDAEAFFVDPKTMDIYIITKREKSARLYLGKYPFDKKINDLVFLKEIKTESMGQLSWITAADISPNGREILMRSYLSIFYYSVGSSSEIEDAFHGSKNKLPFGPGIEIQGEAVCWDAKGEGYYTLSESYKGAEQHLYYYPRKTTSAKEIDGTQVVLRTKNNVYYMDFEKSNLFADSYLEIYNGIGKKVGQFKSDSLNNNEIVFDLTHLSKGLYFCRLNDKTKKILVY